MAGPIDDIVNHPQPPQIFFPRNGDEPTSGDITIRWTHTLAYATISSWYTLQIDDDINFSSPTTYKIFQIAN